MTPERVSFLSGSNLLQGLFFRPARQAPSPGVVVTGSWTSVKEQMSATYAQALAHKGYAALCFDFRGWGESTGTPRYLEDPIRKAADIVAAFDFMAGHEVVDAKRIAGLGICASAGYMSQAAAISPVPRAVCLVAPWLHDEQIVQEVYGGEEGVAALIAKSRAVEHGGETVIEAASVTNPASLMYQAPYYTEPARGLIPQYDNRFDLRSWEPWLRFDGVGSAERLSLPTCIVHSRAAAIPHGTERFAARLGMQASLFWLEGISQFDFYDRPDAVEAAMRHVEAHLATHCR
ncbi:MAG: alpha/beta hydrolase family protein [Proteobacteria bacterium]|nr:alpha/beta hydrolase family protein [Pseudomonadota bacterium]